MSAPLSLLQEDSALFGGNSAFVEQLYEDYLQDPDSVATDWRDFFERLRNEKPLLRPEVAHGPVREAFAKLSRSRHSPLRQQTHGRESTVERKQSAVLRLINAYRVRGHQQARLDPLGRKPPLKVPDLQPEFHYLEEADLQTRFDTGSLFADDRMTLNEIVGLVEDVYCHTIGSEYMHITDTVQKRWIQERIETTRARPGLNNEEKSWVLEMLTAAEGLERYLHTRYVGQKRFSLEGGESLIPLLDEMIQRAGAEGVEEIVLGMAHRGRLNVLTNILGKAPSTLFDEFEGNGEHGHGTTSGDVKYHKGFSSDIETPGGNIHLALSFNPSHLEIINPVVQGSVRARQQHRHDREGQRVVPVLIHGDASFSGQGVVMETLNMSQARGFGTGGTVHIVINNQIGFTTSNPLDARSTLYCTDVAKMIQAPIFHVNADDPEAVIFVTRLALDYRMTFNRDVVIDLVCYRRQGHNEADEPSVTQPQMYQCINQLPTTRAIYAARLIKASVINERTADQMMQNYRSILADGSVVSRPVVEGLTNQYAVNWAPYHDAQWNEVVDTTIDQKTITRLSAQLLDLPADLTLHDRVKKILERRQKMTLGEIPIDWGYAETMAYANLLTTGYPVRLTGQDSGRGTFFHRHAVLHDQTQDRNYTPLQHLSAHQANFLVVDSLLSEEAVLGFEYGYATADPSALVLWEAQFGDFANGAQVVIDQFIASGESKWGRLCSLVMLLPHGFEGQGPEHSSARLERYLQLCAEHNIQVCVPTTPAQMFHLLLRQMLRSFRKPLVVMTCKSMLRNKAATSSLNDLTSGSFEPVISDKSLPDNDAVHRIVVCSGKVYYDLIETRRELQRDDTAIIRLEQIYPFPRALLARAIESFPNATELVWCQEEPHNQGAWDQIKHRFRTLLGDHMKMRYAGRASSAAPAVGNLRVHRQQQQDLINDAIE